MKLISRCHVFIYRQLNLVSVNIVECRLCLVNFEEMLWVMVVNVYESYVRICVWCVNDYLGGDFVGFKLLMLWFWSFVNNMLSRSDYLKSYYCTLNMLCLYLCSCYRKLSTYSMFILLLALLLLLLLILMLLSNIALKSFSKNVNLW